MKGSFFLRGGAPVISVTLFLLWAGYAIHYFSLPPPLSADSSFSLEKRGVQPQALPVSLLGAADNAVSEWRVTGDEPAAEKLRHAPLSALALRVAGIISNGRCDGSLAIIEKNSTQATYGCGVITTEDSVSIVHFFSDMIIINNDGYYESLHLRVKNSESNT